MRRPVLLRVALAAVIGVSGGAIGQVTDRSVIAAEASPLQPTTAAPDAVPLIHIPVREGGLVGELIVPDDGKRHPGVLRLGGSEGGLKTADAKTLAAHGYAVLALAYFGAPGLPADLEEIPLEYFGRAIDWMRTSPRIDAERLGIVGISRGSTLALLLPTIYPGFDAVVAMAPSHVIWQSSYLDWSRYAERSSYSRSAEALPFVPYDFSNKEAMKDCSSKTMACTRMYEISLNQKQHVDKARIPVEKMGAPVLLVSGKSDALWPSSAMGDEIIRRFATENYPYEYRHLSYDAAGHCGLNDCFGGGTAEGNARALSEGRAQTLAFLDRHLRARSAAAR